MERCWDEEGDEEYQDVIREATYYLRGRGRKISFRLNKNRILDIHQILQKAQERGVMTRFYDSTEGYEVTVFVKKIKMGESAVSFLDTVLVGKDKKEVEVGFSLPYGDFTAFKGTGEMFYYAFKVNQEIYRILHENSRKI